MESLKKGLFRVDLQRFLPRNKALHHERCGLSGYVVRISRAERSTRCERHYRDFQGCPYSRNRLRSATPLYGGDRRSIPVLGLFKRRHGWSQSRLRQCGQSFWSRNSTLISGFKGTRHSRSCHRCGAGRRGRGQRFHSYFQFGPPSDAFRASRR